MGVIKEGHSRHHVHRAHAIMIHKLKFDNTVAHKTYGLTTIRIPSGTLAQGGEVCDCSNRTEVCLKKFTRFRYFFPPRRCHPPLFCHPPRVSPASPSTTCHVTMPQGGGVMGGRRGKTCSFKVCVQIEGTCFPPNAMEFPEIFPVKYHVG